MSREEMANRFKKAPVQSPQEFVAEKLNDVVVETAPAPKKVTESEMRLATISKLSTEIYDADIGAKSTGTQKANLFMSQKSSLSLKRAILVQEQEKKHNRDVVVAQRAVEHCFLIGEELKYLALMGDKDAIKMLEKIKAAGVEDYRVYKRQ
jgi:hypothetical protein